MKRTTKTNVPSPTNSRLVYLDLEILTVVGQSARRYRQKHQLSQRSLAKTLKVPRPFLSQFERGLIKSPIQKDSQEDNNMCHIARIFMYKDAVAQKKLAQLKQAKEAA